MIKVNNKKTLHNLSMKSLQASKKRNSIAIFAIILTTILFTSLFTIGSGIVESMQQQLMRQVGGSAHGTLKYISDEQYEDIKDHPLIKEISYQKLMAESIDNEKLLKRHTELWYLDNAGVRMRFLEPKVGSKPKAVNEIMTDTTTLALLGVPHEIGSIVTITYTAKGVQYTNDFSLSGYWESDPAADVGQIIVSKAFTKENEEMLRYEFDKNPSFFSGVICADIMFSNSFQIEEKIIKVIADSGYTSKGGNVVADPTDMAYGVNWVYISNSVVEADPISTTCIIVVAIIILLSGYLIIYNIFQISVLNDVHYYGLLKTIGTTPKQLKTLLLRQAFYLAILGIPIGLLFGFLIGKGLVPIVLNSSNITCVSVSINPIIFLGATLFTLFTVFISVQKPGKIASRISPLEAVCYSGNMKTGKKTLKKSTDGGKIWRMALSNLGRNKKRTRLTVISMSLSLILFLGICTISKAFDIDKFVKNFVDTDFLIGHANYFNAESNKINVDTTLSESFIRAVQEQNTFMEGGIIYTNYYNNASSIKYKNMNQTQSLTQNKAKDGDPLLTLYGMEDFNLSRLDIIAGELDLVKLATGKYIIGGVLLDDSGDAYEDPSQYEVGDTVELHVNGQIHQYILMAKAGINDTTQTMRSYAGCIMILPAKELLQIDEHSFVMSYAFNSTDVEEMEIVVKNYTDQIETTMDYESKQVYVKEFEELRNLFVLVGGFLSLVVGMIGVLNFINSILTSILSRRREFAILQSIGMTNKQLMKMLIMEGIYYVCITVILSLGLGIIVSKYVFAGFEAALWFLSYKFIIYPLLLVYPILFILAVLIPYLAYHNINKRSMVERLRAID